MKLQGGFTLIEMMAVILILGLVMSVVVVNVMDKVEWSKVQVTKVKMGAVASALEMFRLQRADYPDTDPGLVALLDRSSGYGRIVKNEEALDDAWKRRFGYEHPPVRRERGYDLWSFGRDGSEGGEGPDADIVSTD
jgi:general secretion pathway protein G